jgi:hypothetical protein
MKVANVRPLPNITHLKTAIAKNSNVSHVNEINLIRLTFLQGTQVYA